MQVSPSENFAFRRQFLLAPNDVAGLEGWHRARVGKYYLFAHPDLSVTVRENVEAGVTVVLLGYIIDPEHQGHSNADILDRVLQSADCIAAIVAELNQCTGRFVLLCFTPADVVMFHDACGLRTAYYAAYKQEVVVASEPLLLGKAIPLRMGESHKAYLASDYVANNKEHWLPAGCSLFEGVIGLVPNHYLRFSTLTQTRYWPVERLGAPRTDLWSHAAGLLRDAMNSAATRMKLALPMTAGWDSRVILAASRAIAGDLFFYTLRYRDMNLRSSDIRVPRKLLGSLGYQHRVLDCRTVPEDSFRKVYVSNTIPAHFDDWGHIAYGILAGYPADRVCVKGNCSEIARCFYYKTGTHAPIDGLDQLIARVPGWYSVPLIVEHVSRWFEGAVPVANQTGIDVLDLFYWEHRMGGWQAQSQLELDIAQESFTPFNYRRLLQALLCASPKHRCAPHYSGYEAMCRFLWPEVMKFPVNPN